jgi:diguanylate cyclase
VRSRFKDFDFARWIDGIALALVVATPAVALSLQPAVDESRDVSLLGHIVDIAYPAGDILLLGSTIGVIALTGWRPGRAWYLLTLGLSIWVVADALYSVQKVKETYVAGVYDYLWPLGLLFVAYAAWQPRVEHTTPELYGWKAVLLPVACQVFALATQIWGLLATLGESERIMTIAVLTVVIVQLYVSRPRREVRAQTDAHAPPESRAAPPAGPGHGVIPQA